MVIAPTYVIFMRTNQTRDSATVADLKCREIVCSRCVFLHSDRLADNGGSALHAQGKIYVRLRGIKRYFCCPINVLRVTRLYLSFGHRRTNYNLFL